MTHKKRIYKYAESTKKKQKEASVRRTIKKRHFVGGMPAKKNTTKAAKDSKAAALRKGRDYGNQASDQNIKKMKIAAIRDFISKIKERCPYNTLIPLVPNIEYAFNILPDVRIVLYKNNNDSNKYYVIEEFNTQTKRKINTQINTSCSNEIGAFLKQYPDIITTNNFEILLAKFRNKTKKENSLSNTCEDEITDKLTTDMGFNTFLYNLRFLNTDSAENVNNYTSRFKNENDASAQPVINKEQCAEATLLVDFITLLIHCIDVRHDFPLPEYNDIVKNIINDWVAYKNKNHPNLNSILNLCGYNTATIATDFCDSISTSSKTFNAHKGHEKAEHLEQIMCNLLNKLLPDIYLQNPLDSIGAKITADSASNFVNDNSLIVGGNKHNLTESGRNLEKFLNGTNVVIQKCFGFIKNTIDGCSGSCIIPHKTIAQLQTDTYDSNNFFMDNYNNIIYHKIKQKSAEGLDTKYNIYGGLFSITFEGPDIQNITTKITNNNDGSFVVFKGVFSVDVIANLIGTTAPRGNDNANSGLTIVSSSQGLTDPKTDMKVKMIALAGKTFGDHSSITKNMTVVTTCDGFIKHQAYMETINRIVHNYCSNVRQSNNISQNIGINILESKRDSNDKFYQYFKFINEADNNDILIQNKLQTVFLLTDDCNSSVKTSPFEKFLTDLIIKIEREMNKCFNPVQYIILKSTYIRIATFITEVSEWKKTSIALCEYINNNNTTYDPTMLSKLLTLPDISYFKNSENENPCLIKIIEDIFEEYDTPYLSEILKTEPGILNYRSKNGYNKYLHDDVIIVTGGNCTIKKEWLIDADEILSNQTYADININLRDIYYQLTYFLGKHIVGSGRNPTPTEFKLETYLSILKNKLSHLADYENLICAFFTRAFCDAYNLWFKKCLNPVTLDSKKHKPDIITPLPIAQPSIVSLPIAPQSNTQASDSQKKKRTAKDDLPVYNNNAPKDEFSKYINEISNSTITTLDKLNITQLELNKIINCIGLAYDNKDSMDDICNKTFSSLL